MMAKKCQLVYDHTKRHAYQWREICNSLRNAEGARRKFVILKNAHGPVPEHCTAALKGCLKLLRGFWPYVQALHVAA